LGDATLLFAGAKEIFGGTMQHKCTVMQLKFPVYRKLLKKAGGVSCIKETFILKTKYE
jgi:hypothetical protein